ncbi:unnamed protein product [Peniophora sp. CBMAI 1063]|nr:unnamed protein product [Peniophora sp. CBMAI 1063]
MTMQAHGYLFPSNSLVSHTPSSVFGSVLDDDSLEGHSIQPIDNCAVCSHFESATVFGPQSKKPKPGQVHRIFESLFLPVARLLASKGQGGPFRGQLNASVERFIRDRSCRIRPTVVTQSFEDGSFDVYLIGTVDGDKGPDYPMAMDNFTTPIDPLPDTNGRIDPEHVHGAPRWISKSPAYVVTAKYHTECGVGSGMGQVRLERWKEPGPGGEAVVFRFHPRQLDRISRIHQLQWNRWMDMETGLKNRYIVDFQQRLDNKSDASTDRRDQERDSQKKPKAPHPDLEPGLQKLDNGEIAELTLSLNSLSYGRSDARPPRSTRSKVYSDRFSLPTVPEGRQLPRESYLNAADHRVSYASTSGSDFTDPDAPITPEQAQASLSNPRVAGQDMSPILPGILSLPSSSSEVPPSPSNRRTSFEIIPTLTDDVSAKGSKRSRRKLQKRASVGTDRTAKAAAQATSVAESAAAGAPEASERRGGAGGMLRRMASFSGLSRKKA